MQTKNIHWKEQQIAVDLMDDDIFCVHLPNGEIRIQYKADNEGADHWIDLETNHETEQAIELGEILGPLLHT